MSAAVDPAWVARQIAAAPPLTDDQRAEIVRILGPVASEVRDRIEAARATFVKPAPVETGLL